MADLEAIEARLTGAGGPFEMAVEAVLGARMAVFKNRLRSLRALLEASLAQGDKEYLIYEGRRRADRVHGAGDARVRRRPGASPRLCRPATADGVGRDPRRRRPRAPFVPE
jgi:hypothetical protein